LAIDREADEADRAAGRKIACPTLVVSALRDDPELSYDAVAIWSGWAEDVRGTAIDCGHHISEEAPDELARILLDFFASEAKGAESPLRASARGGPRNTRPGDGP
jgi:haloacetate dehalogenase